MKWGQPRCGTLTSAPVIKPRHERAQPRRAQYPSMRLSVNVWGTTGALILQ
ncbi:MAG: hypothetical protein ACTSQY_08320 [Candidatus Odinarchaeia archaeon]